MTARGVKSARGRPAPDHGAIEDLKKEADENGYLSAQRYFVAITATRPDKSEWMIALTPHYATIAHAADELSRLLPAYPRAGIMPVLLLFDPTNEEDVAKWGMHAQAVIQERRKWGQ